ncbi:Sel1 repeat protein [Pelomyxa schiedti]|nr:Sel1 repeat protein [Pelomyxa schiedti]
MTGRWGSLGGAQHGVGVECDKHRAVSLYNDAIAKNKSNSWRLGVCYLRGEGVERDWARAAQLFQQSGGSGDAKAYLGWCYLWGCGAERDVAKAVAMLQSAAASSAKAMVFLGYCLERGIGVAKDPGRADALYDRAKFRVWDAEALGELGLYCQKGDCGAPMDRRAAVGYFLMGAQRGDPVSMFHLGDCDLEQSCHWLEKATQLGHMQASKILSALSFHNAKSLGDCEEAQEEVSNDALIHQVESLKAHIGALQNENRQLASRINNSVAADDTSLKKQIAELKKEKEELQKEKERLLHHVEDTEAALYQEQTAGVTLRDLVGEVERYKIIVNTMTSLISATPSDFGVEKLLGTGSNAAAFKVQYRTTTINSAYHNQGSSALASTFKASPGAIKTTTDMVMKVLFNWENTPQQTMLRQKYMAECVALSLVPTHPNVIHPLGALVIPRYFF